MFTNVKYISTIQCLWELWQPVNLRYNPTSYQSHKGVETYCKPFRLPSTLVLMADVSPQEAGSCTVEDSV